MSISCIQKCVAGDIIVIPEFAQKNREYLVTQGYSYGFYMTSKNPGYLLLRQVSTNRDTFICGTNLRAITRIIKKPK